MYQKRILWLLCATILTSQPTITYPVFAKQEKPIGITLDEAIAKALAGSPRLKSANSALLASEGERTQAGLWQNPELGVEVENVAGDGVYKGTKSAEITYGVSQVIELGGKISSRVAVAEQGLEISRFGQMAQRLDIIRDTTNAYINVIAAQEILKLASEQKTLANELFKEVDERVDAAREPLLQKSKAEITVSTARFTHERAERELGHTKHILSSLWGGHNDGFTLKEKIFFTLTAPMTETEVEAQMEQNPSLKSSQVNHTRMQAKYELEKAQAIPDPRINIGVRNFRDNGDKAFMAGISIPIPVFNRNQGNVQRARHDISKAESDVQTEKLLMIGNVHEALETQINAYRQAKNLKKSILPAAKKAFRLSREGYGVGKLPYLEVLDAQRTLFEVKEQYITTLKEYHIAKAEVERLTASHVGLMENNGESK
jgi:cobalt-zinc-cadmium efflux system outer membrane protein